MAKFTYEFNLENGEVYDFTVDLERPRAKEKATHPPWTELDFHKCRNCPLSSEIHHHCPVAVDIEEVAEQFTDILSFERVEVRVKTKERDYVKNCDVQTGLKSLLGLIMASGTCPTLSQFKPMAYYHLPFATVEETIYRVVGSYLVKQYFINKEGDTPDLALKGLGTLYKELQAVNQDFMTRIRAASRSDANLNAINILFSLSAVVAMTLQSKLNEIKPLFFRELPKGGSPSPSEETGEVVGNVATE